MQAVSEIQRLGGLIMPERISIERHRSVLVKRLVQALRIPAYVQIVQTFVSHVYTLKPANIESFTEDDYASVEECVDTVLRTSMRLLSVATMLPWHRNRLKMLCNQLQEAAYAISRGYAPGALPSDADRAEFAGRQLHEHLTTPH